MDLKQKAQLSLALMQPFRKVVVGVSGGPDSIALAHFLQAEGYDVIVAHLHHGRRGSPADIDQQFVRGWAKSRGLPFVTERADLPKKGNFEAVARDARYAFLEEARATTHSHRIAVAHHADDQIETIILNLMRGCDLSGWVGMMPVRGAIIRPFLKVYKEEIFAYLHRNRLACTQDETNRDLRYRRNLLRHRLIPQLQKEIPDIKAQILDLSQTARDVYAKKHERVQRWMERHVKDQCFSRELFLRLPEDEQRMALREWVGRRNVYRRPLMLMQTFLQNGSTGKRRELNGWWFELAYGHIRFYKAEKTLRATATRPAPEAKPISPGQIVEWNGWRVHLKSGLKLKKKTRLHVRAWQPGDRIRPAGMKGRKKLQDVFTDHKIPRADRHTMPLITDSEGAILAVGDLRWSEHGKGLEKNLEIQKIN